MRRRVAITGIGIVTSHGAGKAANWERIIAGESGIRPVTRFEAGKYRTGKAGQIVDLPVPSWRRVRRSRLDFASNLLHVAFLEALGDTGMSPDALAACSPMVSLGTTLGGMISGERYHETYIRKGPSRALPSLVADHLAHCQPLRIMEEYSLPGVPVVFSDACASGANAVGFAFRAVRGGEADMAVCGGFDSLCEFVFAGFHSLQALTPGLCRPFDRSRDGMVLGEGAGVMFLEPWDRAGARGARILGELIGYGESTDAFHMTRPDPHGAGAISAMRSALADAGVEPDAVGYVNAHGTGTPFNDAMEAAAILAVFGASGDQVPVSSIKPMIGHLLGGAGAVEGIITVLTLQEKRLPPNLNYETPDPACGLRIVRVSERAPCLGVAMSNSFGFGGSNATLVFRSPTGDGV
ncbi:MAG TPA: beta-ketoacyl-[acyl-carrier-protein] synthase II [Deltaproteobacteria bacterium]|nr:beta-ketoacyl-[acyl-carrier-protein] synthase II [Deltaproteobacteria bacterium]